MSQVEQLVTDRSYGAEIARRAGVIYTVRLPDGTEYDALRPDIFKSALEAASKVLREFNAKRAASWAESDPGADGR